MELIGHTPGSVDPDDLAILVAAMLLDAGREPDIRFRTDDSESRVFAIEVWCGNARIASFDCTPVPVSCEEYGVPMRVPMGLREYGKRLNELARRV